MGVTTIGNDYQPNEDIKNPVKKLSKEITQKYVREIVKELTKRAVQKRIESLDDQKIIRLENKLKNLTDKEKINQFKGSRNNIADLITQEGITEKEFIDRANNLFETKIHHWIKLPIEIVLPITTKSILIIIAIQYLRHICCGNNIVFVI